jgi:hypothetical protein
MGEGTNAWRRQMTADPARVSTFLRTMGTPEGARVEEIFNAHIAGSQRLAETVARHMDVPPELAERIAAARSSSGQLRGEMVSIGERARTLNQWRALERSRNATSEVIGAGLGAIAGGVLGGLPGAAIGGALAAGLRSPTVLYRTLGGIDRAVRGVASSMNGAVGGFVRRAGRRAGEAAVGVGRAARAARPVATVLALREFAPAVERVVAANGNPERMRAGLSSRSQRLEQDAPNTARALGAHLERAAAFLAARIPPGARPPPAELQATLWEPRVSDGEKARFLRYVRAVDDPRTVLADLESGALTTEAVEALREVYPETYADLQRTAFNAITEADEPIPYDARLKLGLLLGIPTDPTLDPAFVAAMQASYAAQPSEAGQQPGAQPLLSPSRRAAPQLSGAQQTDTQRIEQRRTA